MKNNEELRQEIDRLYSMVNAITFPFMELVADVNRACGAIAISETTSPSVYVVAAKKELVKIEKAIQNYRQNLGQDYEVKK